MLFRCWMISVLIYNKLPKKMNALVKEDTLPSPEPVVDISNIITCESSQAAYHCIRSKLLGHPKIEAKEIPLYYMEVSKKRPLVVSFVVQSEVNLSFFSQKNTSLTNLSINATIELPSAVLEPKIDYTPS